MTTEVITLILIGALALILSFYHHRQAASLRAIENVVQDYYAMQFRTVRREFAGSLDSLDPFEWVSRHACAGMDTPMAVTDVIRIVPEVLAVDLRTSDNRRVVISPHSWQELYYFDRKARRAKKGTDRLASFAARPLLTNNRFGWGIKSIECLTSNTDEFFDLEAEVVGRKFGIHWHQPTRLYLHVVG